jgi:hypothetical protein
LQAKEIQKEREQKKREKLEEAKAKAAVKAQIEADKKARAEKAAKEKALREGRPIVDAAAAAPSKPVPTVSSSGSAAKEARIQIRLPSGGQPLTTTLPSESTLQEVANFVAAQNPAFNPNALSFTQSFPRKTFTQADFSKTLKELGLTPSAALMAS